MNHAQDKDFGRGKKKRETAYCSTTIYIISILLKHVPWEIACCLPTGVWGPFPKPLGAGIKMLRVGNYWRHGMGKRIVCALYHHVKANAAQRRQQSGELVLVP